MGITTNRSDNEIVINNVVSDVTADEIVNYVRDNVEKWIGKPVLWDVSKSKISNIPPKEWIGIIDQLVQSSQRRNGQKTALVSSVDRNFGMLRMFEMSAENKLSIHLQTFRDLNLAKAWLLK